MTIRLTFLQGLYNYYNKELRVNTMTSNDRQVNHNFSLSKNVCYIYQRKTALAVIDFRQLEQDKYEIRFGENILFSQISRDIFFYFFSFFDIFHLYNYI